MQKEPLGPRRGSLELLALFLVLALAIATLGYRLHESQKKDLTREVQNQLVAITDLKVSQLSEWRRAHLGQARAILSGGMTMRAFHDYIAGKRTQQQRDLLAKWMQGRNRELGYAGIDLMDVSGKLVLSEGRKFGDARHLAAVTAATLAAGDVQLTDLHLEGNEIHMGLNFPLRLAPGEKPFGALLMAIDPTTNLYPMLEKWPLPSKSGEPVLVRRDGDRVTYLNELRAKPDSALHLSMPLSQTNLPAVRAVLGYEGAFEGSDYRGVPVFAASRHVPDSNWFLVAKVDSEELHGPLLRRSILVGLTTFSLIAAAGAAVFLFWRRRHLEFYRAQYRAESQRRSADEELREVQERFRVVVEHAAPAIAVVNDSIFLYVNPAAVHILGARNAEELVGTSYLERLHPDHRSALRDRLDQVGKGKPVPLLERRYLRLDGTEFPAEAAAVPIEWEHKPAALVFFQDITQRKRAEADRERLEQQFLHAQKMESVGRLAGGVAHDFNNLLTIISGYTDMLLHSRPPGDPDIQDLEEIHAAAGRAAGLTQQLLAFSRKQVTEPRPTSLNGVVEEDSKMLRRLIGEDTRIVTNLEPHLEPVMVDIGHMHQVLMNLTVNARDAMPRGGTITLRTANVEIEPGHPTVPAGRYAVLSVEDTGVGIDAETVPKIFDPFFTTKPAGFGTGLGLSTVYGIVKQSDGWIDVSSKVNEGTTFSIYLPVCQPDAKPSEADRGSHRALGGNETILLVEDQADVRRLTARILKNGGYRLLEADCGEAALAVAEAHKDHIDLLLTDVIMPGMTGPELAERLREVRPTTKVLFISGYTAGALTAGLESAPVDYLKKPFTPDELARRVRAALKA